MKLINKTNDKELFRKVKESWIIDGKESWLNFNKIKREIEIEGCFEYSHYSVLGHLTKSGNIVVTDIVR